MFRLIYFEWRKTYTNCALVFTFLIFLSINIFNIAYQNQQKSYFADSKEWRSAYWELYPTFSGVITAEKAESLMALYRPLAESVSDLTFNTAQDKNSLTGINQYSDYLLLDRFYVTPMQYFVGYGNYATSISQKALENFKYYSSTDNSYEAKKSLQIYTLFSDRRISSFAYTEPFEHLTSYTFSSVLILCICLLGTSNLFSQEHECHMFSLIKTTKYGNRLSIHAKLITSLFFSIFVSVCFSICDLVAFNIIYGNFDGASLPLYALKVFPQPLFQATSINICSFKYFQKSSPSFHLHSLFLFSLLSQKQHFSLFSLAHLLFQLVYYLHKKISILPSVGLKLLTQPLCSVAKNSISPHLLLIFSMNQF